MEVLFSFMKLKSVVIMQILIVLIVMMVSGCAAPTGHQMAFSDKTALVGNTKLLDLTVPQATKVTKQVLVRQGFTIDSVDVNSGLIKSSRNFQDTAKPEQSYNITTSAYIFENGPNSTSLTISASEQTILHREWTTWWHLLWILPVIPTGTEYQTVVTKEGNITDPIFYTDFFKAVTAAGVDVKAADKAAEMKVAAEKAAEEKAIALKAAAEKAATEKAVALKVAEEKAATEKAMAEKASAEKAATEKAAEEKVAAEAIATAEKAAAQKAEADSAALKNKKKAKKKVKQTAKNN